ncbi:MAG: hydroxymethylbilane synthase [Acutalibacteraceae bacterium]
MRNFVVATRKSALAMKQTEIVRQALEKAGAGSSVLSVSTKGDKSALPLHKIGGDGLFVREIEKALFSKDADLAVHSAKDLPFALSDGLMIGAVMPAASGADVLIVRKGESLKSGAVIGTSSPRRIAQAKRLFPSCKFQDIRGNVDTRLSKLRSEEYDAIILAKAGLDRLKIDLSDFDITVFECEKFIPAACQGIIAVQCRKDDTETVKLLEKISDENAQKRFEAERYMFSLLNADCSQPAGVYSVTQDDEIEIYAFFKGKTAKRHGKYSDYKKICQEIRDELNG